MSGCASRLAPRETQHIRGELETLLGSLAPDIEEGASAGLMML